MDKQTQNLSSPSLLRRPVRSSPFASVIFRENPIKRINGFVTDYYETLPDEPAPPEFLMDRLARLFHLALVDGILNSTVYQFRKLDPTERSYEANRYLLSDEDYYESLPEKRVIAYFDDGLKQEIEDGVHEAFRSVVYSSHCRTKAIMLKMQAIAKEMTTQSGRELHQERRERRDQIQRDAAKKKLEEEKKKVPKTKRMQERKATRAIREMTKIQLQGLRDLAAGAAFTALGVLGVRLMRKTDRMLDDLTSFLNGIRSAGAQLRGILKHLWFVPLVLLLKFFVGQWRNSVLTAALIAFMPKFFGFDLWTHISEFFPSGEIELQSNFDVFSKLLSVAFTFSVFRGKVSASKVGEFCKRLANIERMSKGWEAFLTWTMTALECLVNYVRERFGKERVELFKRADKLALDWASDVEDFLKEDAIGKEIDPAILDRVLALLQQGYGLKESYRNTEVGKLIDVLVARLSTAVAPHLGSVSARNNFRFEPVATFLYGLPGTGKTLMAVPFVAALLLKSGLVETPCTPDDVTREMWQKGTSEYWQGYDRQKAIIMDDAFQNRAFSGDKDNDYFNMIKMCGSFSMPLNFADLASKGKIFFASKLIFGSTNLASITSEARVVIQEPEAVARRINFGFQLFVNDEYKKYDGKLDYALFRREWDKCIENLQPGDDPLLAFPWYIWYVQQHDFIHGSSVGAQIPLSAAIVMISNELTMRLQSHDITKTYLDKMITSYGVVAQAGRTLMDDHAYVVGSAVKLMKKALAKTRDAFMDDTKCVGQLFKIAVFATGSFFALKLIEAVLSALYRLLTGIFSRKKKTSLQSNRPLTKAVPIKSKITLQHGGTKVVMDNIYANTYKMFHKSSKFVIGQVLFIMGELAVQPQHFTETVEEQLSKGVFSPDDKLVFRNSVNADHSVEFTVEQYLAFKRLSKRDSDVEFIKFESIRAHRKIINSFVTERDVRYVGGNPGILHVCEVDDRRTLLNTTMRQAWRLPSINVGKSPLYFDDRRMDRYYSYGVITSAGDCGAPLTLENADVFGGRCMLGIHCAARLTDNTGFSNVITREMVDQAVKEFSIIEDNFADDIESRGIKLQCGDDLPFVNMGSFLPIGTVDKPISISPKSKFYKTHLYGSIGEYTHAPAILGPVVRNWERIWPMEQAVKPYSSPLLHLELPLLQDAVHTAFKPFVEQTRNVNRELYDFEDAVRGVPQDKFRSIPRNTAAGFPYVYDVKGGKKEFFGEEMDYDLTGQRARDLRKRVDYILDQARKGIRLSHVYVDFLKDELRPIEKVEAVATRLISSAPLDYVVAWRILFGNFSSAMMRHNVATGMAPGICTYSDWSRVAMYLQQHGSAVFDGDFKAFDSSEQPCVHDAILEAINLWYNDSHENQLARKVLWLDLVHSRHIGGRGDNQRYIYQWNHSLPSGHPFTTVVNSLYSLVTLIYCYFDLTNDRRNFWGHVSPLTYGDDNVCNVDDDKVESFNQITVSESMKKNFNLTYTAGHKDQDLEPYTDLAHVTFLKRGFLLDKGRWLCPLELESFLFTHYWCKNKKLETQILISDLENALEELALHEPSLWSVYGRRVADILRDKFGRETNCCPTRESYLSLVLSRTDEWY
ncbi:hypothetical protein 1 [Hubei picorna-like virus 20]|uniref:hypothetical protein 1 n=1 Tax=Hubei picorna-like virus 20 TaxID=1923100 RepID=UPI00090B1C3A|nr:hypothetical protein 1 [Hubei picorna-like virus 20]APG78376.1 hypothetical protein 1 [Hubei picorna-like virus 20]